jgi:multidrug/hemolysin transport system permease protein
MIRDREEGLLNDVLVSPVKRQVITLAYFIYNFFVTLAVCGIVLAVSFVYLAFAGWYLSLADVLSLIGLLLLSVLSSAFFSTFLCSFFKTGQAHGAFVGILSAAIGFLVGAYMPLSMFPAGVRYFALLLPGTYSAGAFRFLFMSGGLAEIAAAAPQAAEALRVNFSMSLDFFGTEIGIGVMLPILAASAVLFAGLNFIVHKWRKNR